MTSYADILKMVESNPNNLYVAVFYTPNYFEWLPVDKVIFARSIKLIGHPETTEYPCLFEVEPDGEMFIHPKGKSDLSIHPDYQPKA